MAGWLCVLRRPQGPCVRVLRTVAILEEVSLVFEVVEELIAGILRASGLPLAWVAEHCAMALSCVLARDGIYGICACWSLFGIIWSVCV